ncbi:MAG TPA: hypothetical protein DEO38_04095 [Bacteroidales bacterium]|nr:hypothetical protein [Bacteroidales bacterium]
MKKLRVIIGAILALAATFRLLCLFGIIPLHFMSEQWESIYEPYIAAFIILFVGTMVCYDGLKGDK